MQQLIEETVRALEAMELLHEPLHIVSDLRTLKARIKASQHSLQPLQDLNTVLKKRLHDQQRPEPRESLKTQPYEEEEEPSKENFDPNLTTRSVKNLLKLCKHNNSQPITTEFLSMSSGEAPVSTPSQMLKTQPGPSSHLPMRIKLKPKCSAQATVLREAVDDLLGLYTTNSALPEFSVDTYN